MITLLLLLLSVSDARAQTDPPALALALVDVARNDAGIGPNPTRGKLASGPFLIDSLTWAMHFDFAFRSNAGDVVIQTLKNNGYSFGNHEVLRRITTTAEGLLRDSLEGDAIVLNLVGLLKKRDRAMARLSLFYTEQNRRVCPRTLEVVFVPSDSGWALTSKEVIGDC